MNKKDRPLQRDYLTLRKIVVLTRHPWVDEIRITILPDEVNLSKCSAQDLGALQEEVAGRSTGINRSVIKAVVSLLDNDLVINVTKSKKLTNMRASGSDDKVRLIPPIQFSLEEALEYIKEDEYVEVTPKAMRMRKVILDEIERKRANKN